MKISVTVRQITIREEVSVSVTGRISGVEVSVSDKGVLKERRYR